MKTKKRLNLAFFVPQYYPYLIGGIEYYVFNLTSILSKKHNIFIFAPETKETKKQNFYKKIRIFRIKTIALSYRLKFWVNLSNVIKKLHKKHKLDYIISFDYAQVQSWIAMRFAKRNNIPFVLFVYDIQSTKKPRSILKQIPLIIFESLFAKNIFKNSSLIFTRTKDPHKWLIKKGVETKKLKIAPPGINNDSYKLSNEKLFENRFKISNNIILFIGWIHPKKGVDTLIEAFYLVKKKIPDAKLVFIGTDKNIQYKYSFIEKAKKHIEKVGLKDVYFLGEIHGALKNSAIAASSLLALPSASEAFGVVLLEAMAQKKPVIACNNTGMRYVFKNGKEGFLIPYGNANILAKKIIFLLNNKGISRKMGERGRLLAKKYTYEKLSNDFIENLKNV